MKNEEITLYEKIGAENLQLILDDFYDLVFSSDIIGPLFKGDKEEIKSKQFKFLTQFLGGPQLYSEQYGHPRMRMRHMPHKITDRGKDEWLKCMKKAINNHLGNSELGEQFYLCFPKIAAHMVNS